MHVHPPWWIQDMLEGWRTSPVRVLLTLFAVGTGSLTLTLLLAVMGGLREQARQLTRDFGANTAILELEENGRTALTRSRLATLQAQFPDTQWIGERRYGPLDLPGLGRITLYAATPGWETARSLRLREGRAPDRFDAENRSPYALASADLNLSPGDLLRLQHTELIIIGVTGPGRFLLIPDTLRGDWEHPDDAEHYHRFRMVHTTGDPMPALHAASAKLTREAPNAALHTITPDLLLAETRRLSDILRRIFGSVTLLSLLLGGATLGSLMVQNIRQRRREIGLRLAIGARRRDLFGLFMLEALLLTTFAALIGILAASHLLHHIPADLEIPLKTDGFVRSIPLITAWITGALFSWIPAQTAAGMTPARALRCED